MRRNWKIRKGSITIFLALFLTVFVGLLYVGLRSAKMAAARTQALCSGDIGLFSLFGQYDREAFRECGLFLLRGMQDGEGVDLASLYYQYRTYAEPVLQENHQNMELLQGGFSGYRLVTDEGGAPFYEQAVKVEKLQPDGKKESDLPMSFAEMESLKSQGKAFEEEMWRCLENLDGEVSLSDGEEPEEMSSEMQMQEQKREELLDLLRQPLLTRLQIAEDSFALLDAGSLLSKRNRETGIPLLDNYVPDLSPGNMPYMRGFLMRNLGHYGKDGKEKLCGALEYVIVGENEDRKNIEPLAEQLLWIMEGIECGNLETEERNIVWYHRVYEQSIRDVRAIFAGGRQQNLSYEDYLRIQLMGCTRDQLIWRGMDMVEQKLRGGKNPHFCMDHCLVAAEMNMFVKVNGQSTFQVTKQYGYE